MPGSGETQGGLGLLDSLVLTRFAFGRAAETSVDIICAQEAN